MYLYNHIYSIVIYKMRTIILLIILSIDFSYQINPPLGTSSVTFVFDVTGSMHDDLLQVIQGATHIYNATLRREYSIYDYILIPFADPGKRKCIFIYIYLFGMHLSSLVLSFQRCNFYFGESYGLRNKRYGVIKMVTIAQMAILMEDYM